MRTWLAVAWRGWQRSYDADEVVQTSTPSSVAIAAGGMLVVLTLIGYVPPFATASHFRHPWVAMVLAVLAGAATLTTWRLRGRGLVATVATLVDSALYSGAMVYAATNTAPAFGVGIAIAHALMLLTFQSRVYGLSLIWALVLAVPLLQIPLFSPQPTVAIVLISTYVLALGMAQLTGHRRELVARQRRLVQALGAADQMAETSLQAALATRLLTFGHFLHELRNRQTAVLTGLLVVEQEGGLGPGAREALAFVKEAALAERALVQSVVDDLKVRSTARASSFELSTVVAEVVAAAEDVRVHEDVRALGVRLSGAAEHLRLVLENLVRNAAQAGARNVHIEGRPEPGGLSIELAVHDDGPGIPEARRPLLFRAFETSRGEGTGLGLYLCRRHVELLGGTITVDVGGLGGTAFILRLPLADAEGEPEAASVPGHGVPLPT